MKSIRVCIVDEHALIRHGLRALLGTEACWQVVGEAGSAEATSPLLAPLRPDLLLIDLSIFRVPAAESVPAIAEKSPLTKIIALTLQEDFSYAQETLHAGAAAYLTKSAAETELLATLRAVADGRTIISLRADARGHALPSPKGRSRIATETLSSREREVLNLVARGFTSAEISAKLFLSVKTVETYRARMMTKLQLSSRAELMEFVAGRDTARDASAT